MINNFKESEVRESALIYQSTLEQIKKLYKSDPNMAGELAISAIELALTGEISSDNPMIDVILENMKYVSQKNFDKWEKTKEAKKQKKIDELQLDTIAALYLEGKTQSQISKALDTTQQVISYRLRIIRENYPHLLNLS